MVALPNINEFKYRKTNIACAICVPTKLNRSRMHGHGAGLTVLAGLSVPGLLFSPAGVRQTR